MTKSVPFAEFYVGSTAVSIRIRMSSLPREHVVSCLRNRLFGLRVRVSIAFCSMFMLLGGVIVSASRACYNID